MIECTDVAFTYDGERFALRGLNLSVRRGEFVCVLGGNGSGKSTLAKHLNALLVPDEGRVVVDGLDTSDPSLTFDIRSTAGMVFQNPDDQLVATLVEDDVAFGPENLGVEPGEIAERVRAALKEVGLVGFERHETHALSGGQKQRVAIAGVLAMDPSVLILDEASAMLDPRGRAGLMRVCRELNERGMTIIMITHFMEEATAADRVVVVDGGRVVVEGAPHEVLTRVEELRALNLEVPPACELGLALQRAGAEVSVHVREEDAVAEIVRAARRCGALGEGLPAEAREAGTAAGEGAESGQVAAAPAAGDVAAAEPLLAFEHVSYSYVAPRERRRRSKRADKGASASAPAWGNAPDASWALHDVSFTLARGEFLGIAGHTGSGKSTLVQHMNGLIHPTEGRVTVAGEDLADKHVSAAAKTRVGVVFQYPEHQLFAATVYDDVAFGPRNLKLPEDEVDARVREALGLVGFDFEAVRAMSPFELSGGQQRRAAFAGVLAMRPEVLVLDEPAAGLDPRARRDFLALIARLHARGLTVVMVSHSMDDLAALCSRVLVLNAGEVFAAGTPREVFLRGEDLRGIGLGVPAAQRMAMRLIACGVPLAEGRLYTIESLAAEVARCLHLGGAA